MPAYTTDSNDHGGRRQVVVAVLLLVVALVLNFVPVSAQQEVASLLRSTVLRPFVLTQEAISETRTRAIESSDLRARLDSLVAVSTSRTHMEDENRRLRGLLSLSGRLEAGYVAASVIRPGTAGSESMFVLDVGAEAGVRSPAPVVTRHGLVGSVLGVRDRSAIGMDWTHPDFRASATTLDGTTTGIVESNRGDFREQDRLVLTGTTFHQTLEEGTVIVTSGLGGVYPRGIPVGRVRGLAQADAGWRKSYWLEPFVDPGSVTHVLVLLPPGEGGAADIRTAWPEDSIVGQEVLIRAEQARSDSLEAIQDSIAMLRGILEVQRQQDSLRRAVMEGDTTPPSRPAAPSAAPSQPAAGAGRTPSPAAPTSPEAEATPDPVPEGETERPILTPQTRLPPDTTEPDTSVAPPDTNRVRMVPVEGAGG